MRRPILAALLFAVLAIASLSAKAQEPAVITGIEQASASKRFDIVFTLTATAKTQLVEMRNPDRLALDFTGAVPAVPLDKIAANPFVKEVRHGLVSKDRYRFLFTLTKPAAAELQRETTEKGETLTLAIQAPGKDGTKPAFVASAPRTAPAVSAPLAARRFVVVIDPGHGGIDNGAVSKLGTMEKEINLAFGKELSAALTEAGGIEPVLTRADDTFIPLEKRSEIARERRADLFISLHADSIRYPDIRGATVYTLSDRASDALASQIADSENAADRFAGPEWHDEEPEVFDILVDLTRRETVSFSEHFATSLVGGLDKHDVKLIKNPKRSAGFKVLRAPDVPSVLVELGYLSNTEDEKLLLDPAWRTKTAKAVAAATVEFLHSHDGRARSAER